MFGLQALTRITFVGLLSLVLARPVESHGTSPCRTIIAAAKVRMQTDSDGARLFAEKAEHCANATEDPPARELTIATAKWLQGEAYLRARNVAHAAPLISAAKEMAKVYAPGTVLQGDILQSNGGVHQERGEVAQALADYQKSYALFNQSGDLRSKSVSLLNIAILYYWSKDFDSMLKYLNQAEDNYTLDKNLLVSIYTSRGLAFQESNKPRDAEHQYRKALAIANNMSSASLQARIIGNIASVRLKAGDSSVASVLIRQGYAITAAGEARIERPQFVELAAREALARHEYARAVTLIESRFAGVDLATTTLTFRDAHETAYEAYRATGDPARALVHLAALKRLDDKATALAASSNTALMAARFDFANQALKIAKLQAQDLRRGIAFQQARTRSQRTMFLGATGAAAVVMALLAFALVTSRRARRKVDAVAADLAVTNGSLAHALAARTEFLATTSHEIRTPLNGILGMTQVMLADRTLSDAVRDRIGVVHAAGDTMRVLVDDILDVAKMETGKLALERVVFDLDATIAEAARMWQEQARAKGIGFVVDLANSPGRIEGDPARVRQIVFNLLSNALKFTAAGEVRLTVAPAMGGNYTIAVADTGIGIARHNRAAIFESFRQADAGTTRRFGGSGLGLAICRNLALAMDGAIRVDSVEGEGSVFTVTLPLVRASGDTSRRTGSEGSLAPVLLIVDRNPIARTMFRTLLERHVGTVVFAETAAEAILRLDAGGIAHVLVDEATVRETGDPVTTIAAIAAAGRETAVTVLWSGADVSGLGAIEGADVARVVAKPIGGAALAAAMFGTKSTDRVPQPLVSHAA